MRIALAQINPTVGDLRLNVRKHLDFIGRAKDAGATLVVFPELSVTGYPPKDLLLTPPDGAKVGFSDSYPKIEFSWQSLGDASGYKLVVGRGAVPSVDPIVTIPTEGQKVEVGSLREGVYHWGVYAVVDGRDEPIFMISRYVSHTQ
jgi:hypothetical protein